MLFDPESPIPAVSVAAFRNEHVLLVQRAQPPYSHLWSLPGGRVKDGESAPDAARREFLEETGLAAHCLVFGLRHDVVVDRGEGRQRMHYSIAVFFSNTISGTLKPGDDALNAEWFSLKNLSNLALTPGLRDVIALLAAKQREP